MSFFHFANCVILAYAPYLIAYKYSGLSEYESIWKCAQAALIYFITQFIKMLTFATFFPASDVDGFDPVSELVKSGADILDVLGLHIAISYWLSGKGEVRFLAAGLGWAAAHSLASYLVGFVVGARTTAFHWKYIQAALESNVDLVFYFCMAALVWMFNRSDLSAAIKRLVGLLLLFCTFQIFIYQLLHSQLNLTSWGLIVTKALSTLGLAGLTVVSYAGVGYAQPHQKVA